MRHIDLLRGLQTLAELYQRPPARVAAFVLDCVTVAGRWRTTMTEGHLRACLAVAVRLRSRVNVRHLPCCMTARQRMCVCLVFVGPNCLPVSLHVAPAGALAQIPRVSTRHAWGPHCK